MFTQNKWLDYKELSKEYPKATAKLVEWTDYGLKAFQKMLSSQMQVTEDVKIPEITKEHAERATEGLLTSYHRTLFDFFDGNNLHISVTYYFTGKWMYEIKSKDGSGLGSGNDFEGRIAAENVAIKQAFHLLNESL